MAETLYDTLSHTATAFMRSMLPRTPGSTDFQPDAILALLDQSFTMDWGHNLFISTMPKLRGDKSGKEFVEHMNANSQLLKTWEINITDVSIDAKARSVVVRADFRMVPKTGDAVVNDIIFWMTLDESGKKLIRCTEFLDPVAVRALGTSIQQSSPS